MLGRMVVPNMKRIFEDGGREASMFLISSTTPIFPPQMQKFPAGCALVDLAKCMW
jgi:hypothetical protein